MKNVQLKQELKKLTYAQLSEQLIAVSQEYFVVRLQAKTSHVKDNSRFAKFRRLIARIKTYMRHHELGVQ